MSLCPVVWQAAGSECQTKNSARIRRVESGNSGDWKAVGKNVLELRIDHGPGYRIYLGRDDEEVVILLVKRTQGRDITTAKAYWADYQARRQEEQHGSDP